MDLALVAAVLLGVAALLQVGLAFGAPWGSISYGGRMANPNGTLPTRLRLMSAVAAAVLLFAAYVVLAPGGPVESGWSQDFLTWATWVIAGLMVLNTIGNLASSNAIERFALGSMTAAVAVLAGLVALRGPNL